MPLPVLQMPAIEDDVVIFQGGLDLKTPNLKLKPGHVRSAQNWQCVVNNDGGGGYERVGGYEPFDSGPAPSSMTYHILTFSAWVHSPDEWVYTTIPPTWPFPINYPTHLSQVYFYGQTSGGIAKVILYVDETVPDYYTGTIYVVVTALRGTFLAGEQIVVMGADIAGNLQPYVAVVGTLVDFGNGSSISAQHQAQFLNLAADFARSRVNPVQDELTGGEGSILGVFTLVVNGNRKVYAFRNHTPSEARLYVASVNSNYIYSSSSLPYDGIWDAVYLGHEIRFTSGGTSGNPTAPLDGHHLVQGSANWEILRVVHESGEWESGTAAGRLIIQIPSPFFNFTAGAATAGAIPMTLSGIQTAITLLPNGKYQFDVHNFGGQLSTRRIYGADGVNRAFEFDGSVFVPIETPAAQDTPKFIRAHQQHLLFFIGSSVIGSGPGVPYQVNAAAGGFEIALGDEVTGSLVQSGTQGSGALAIFTRNGSGLLYGTSAADFEYVRLVGATGSLPYMAQNLDQGYVFDDRGVLSLQAAQEYGNFKHATITENLDKFLIQRKQIASCSCVSVERSQLRLFFLDGTALYLTIVNGRLIGAMPMVFPHVFSCIWSAEDASGNEETFAGGVDGYVYQLDRGSSFDGEPIDHHLYFTNNYMKAPQIKKQFRNGVLEVQSDYYAEFSVGYRLNYGNTKLFQPNENEYASDFSAAPAWDSITWDNFVWDGATLSPSKVEIKGKAEAIEMLVMGSSNYIYPFTLSSLITHFNYTRRTR